MASSEIFFKIDSYKPGLFLYFTPSTIMESSVSISNLIIAEHYIVLAEVHKRDRSCFFCHREEYLRFALADLVSCTTSHSFIAFAKSV